MSQFHTNPLARLPLHVTAGTTALVVNVIASWVGVVGIADYGIGVYIDGVYSRELQTVANGITEFTIALDGAAHDVTLVNSYQNPAPRLGAFVYSYAATGGVATVRTVAVPAAKWVLYGDSILTGAYATIIPRDSWAARLQNLLPEGAVSLESFGGRGLYTDAGVTANQLGIGGMGSFANLADRFAFHLRGATTKTVVMQIGVNDALTPLWSAASYGAGLATLFDAIHAVDPTIHIEFWSPIVCTSDATVAPYRAQAVIACAGRAWVTYRDGLTFMTASGLSGDGLHPTDNGHLAIFNGTGPNAGSMNARLALGV